MSRWGDVLWWSLDALSPRTVVAFCTPATWLGSSSPVAVVTRRTRLASLHRRPAEGPWRTTRHMHINWKLIHTLIYFLQVLNWCLLTCKQADVHKTTQIEVNLMQSACSLVGLWFINTNRATEHLIGFLYFAARQEYNYTIKPLCYWIYSICAQGERKRGFNGNVFTFTELQRYTSVHVRRRKLAGEKKKRTLCATKRISYYIVSHSRIINSYTWSTASHM